MQHLTSDSGQRVNLDGTESRVVRWAMRETVGRRASYEIRSNMPRPEECLALHCVGLGFGKFLRVSKLGRHEGDVPARERGVDGPSDVVTFRTIRRVSVPIAYSLLVFVLLHKSSSLAHRGAMLLFFA